MLKFNELPFFEFKKLATTWEYKEASINTVREGIKEFAAQLLDKFDVSDYDRGFFRIIVRFPEDDPERCDINIGNLFTALLMYGKYIPAKVLGLKSPEDLSKNSFLDKNGDEVKYNFESREFVFIPVKPVEDIEVTFKLVEPLKKTYKKGEHDGYKIGEHILVHRLFQNYEHWFITVRKLHIFSQHLCLMNATEEEIISVVKKKIDEYNVLLGEINGSIDKHI